MNHIQLALKELEHRRETLKNALAEGSARDFSEYKAMAGEIQGLSFAHSILTDLVRKLEFDDE